MTLFAGCLAAVGATVAVVVGGIARMALLYLMWNTLVVPTLGWPPVSFGAVAALVLTYSFAFRMKVTESAKEKRDDTRTPAERTEDTVADIVSAYVVLAAAWAIYGVAYLVIR